MGYDLAVFLSVHLVNRMKSRLNQGGEYVGMLRTPHSISAGGCSFALRFEESKLHVVKETAQELGVDINGIYKEELRENGSRVYTKIE